LARSTPRWPPGWHCATTAARAFAPITTRPRSTSVGIARSPAFHYEPETNGCVEKFIQTLKEQVLWIERFDTLDELRTRIRRFARDFNEHWLLERHSYRTPAQARERSVRPP